MDIIATGIVLLGCLYASVIACVCVELCKTDIDRYIIITLFGIISSILAIYITATI